MKSIPIKFNKQELKKVKWIILAALLILLGLWKYRYSDLTIPVQHKSTIVEGNFSTSIGMVRQIAIRDVTIPRRENGWIEVLDLQVYTPDGTMVWEKTYRNLEMKYDFNIIDEYEKEDPLVLEKGNYIVKCLRNGAQTDDVIVRFTEYSGTPGKLYVGLCIFLAVVLGCCITVNCLQDMKLHYAYLVMAIALGILYNVAFPPLSAGDEIYHFMESYRISSYLMITPAEQDGKLILRADDFDSLEYLHDMAGVSGWYASWEKGNIKDTVLLNEVSAVSSKSKYVYIIPAIGITIARLLHLSGHTLLLLGRLFAMVANALIISLAIKLIPYGKQLFLVIGLLPEVIYLTASYSYDGVNMALCMLIGAYFLYLCQTVEKITLKHIGILLVLLAIMTPIKIIYVVFAALLILLPKEKLTISKKTIFLAMAGIAVVGVIFILLNFKSIRSILGTGGTYAYDPTGLYSLDFILKNREMTRNVYLNTFFFRGDYYFSASMGEILARDPIDGRDMYLIPGFLQVVIIALAGIGLTDTRSNRLPLWKRIIAALMCGLLLLLVYTSMLLSDTLVSDWRIMSIQGRYLLPIYALLPIVFANKRVSLQLDKDKVCLWGMTLVNIAFVMLANYHYAYVYFAGNNPLG